MEWGVYQSISGNTMCCKELVMWITSCPSMNCTPQTTPSIMDNVISSLLELAILSIQCLLAGCVGKHPPIAHVSDPSLYDLAAGPCVITVVQSNLHCTLPGHCLYSCLWVDHIHSGHELHIQEAEINKPHSLKNYKYSCPPKAYSCVVSGKWQMAGT